MKRNRIQLILLVVLFSIFFSLVGKAAETPSGPTVEEGYLGLSMGPLRMARLVSLPVGIILRSGELTINEKQITEQITSGKPEIQNQLQKNAFYVLEQVATRPLILQEAKKWADQSGQNSKSATDDALLQKFLESIAPANLRVSEEEAKTFYDQNQEAFGETPYDTVKPQVDEFLLSQKKQNAINTYIGSLSEHLPVEVSADWTKQQSILTLENPVDQARRSGKPAMIDFGASGCIPCDMMAPILKELATTYSGKCSVLFIDVRNEQVLAARYGISVIPTQLFFDPSGKEISRHTGFFPRDQILEQLATAGVK